MVKEELKTILDGDFKDAMRTQMLMWGKGKYHVWPAEFPTHIVYFLVPFRKTIEPFNTLRGAYDWLASEGYTVDWVDGDTMSISKTFKRGEVSGKEN